jgi:glutaredoxin-like protein NrdH
MLLATYTSMKTNTKFGNLNSYICLKPNFICEIFNMQFAKVSGTKKNHKVSVYTLSTCVWCKMTKQYLNENGVEYEYVDVDLLDDNDKSIVHSTIISKGGALSYPTTIIDDKTVITGYRKDLLKEDLGL